MLAAMNAKLEVINYLLSKGADANLKDINGKTALDYAKAADVTEYLTKSIPDKLDKDAAIAVLSKVTK